MDKNEVWTNIQIVDLTFVNFCLDDKMEDY